jgi:predicted DNA-binding transcriptional regulator YafY
MATPLAPADLRVKRCVWLYSRLAKRGSVDYGAYSRHFGATSRSYYRDLSTLRRIGVRMESVRDHGHVSFISEAL